MNWITKKDQQGNFFSFFPSSSYCGLFFVDEKFGMFKTIHSLCCNKCLDFEINGNFFIRPKEKCSITFNLDPREIYQKEKFGRIFNLKKISEGILVEYRKYGGWEIKEENLEYKRFILVSKARDFRAIGKWKKVYFDYDARRGEEREGFVYEAFEVFADKKITVTFGLSEEECISKLGKKAKKEKIFISSLIPGSSVAKKCASSIEELYNAKKGFSAGLPWFFQVWARDELFSLLCLKNIKKKIIRDAVFRYLSLEEISSYRDSGLKSADAPGLLAALIRKNIRIFSKQEKDLIRNFFLEKERKLDIRNNLLFCRKKETWMDTLEREGARIEMQALLLNIYFLLDILGEERKTKIELVRKEVKRQFVAGEVLFDSPEKKEIRPNVFLACFFFPELFSKKEWELFFDSCIKEMWLEWGGFSTISKNSPLFEKRHTGIDNKSYHNGDSWYFVNNVAAYCMAKINKKKYSGKIAKVREASVRDFLETNAKECCSEISSAEKHESFGCWSQLWSAATLLLILEGQNQ